MDDPIITNSTGQKRKGVSYVLTEKVGKLRESVQNAATAYDQNTSLSFIVPNEPNEYSQSQSVMFRLFFLEVLFLFF